MEASQLKYGFLANHRVLVERVEPRGLLPYLIAENVISFEEREAIRHEVTASLMVDKLLTIVHRKGVTDPAIYTRLLGVLREAGATGGQYLESIVASIETESQREDIQNQFEYTMGVLEEKHNAALRAHEQMIIQSLDVAEVLPSMITFGAITPEENAVIRSAPTQNDKARRLVNIIYQKGSNAFAKFVVALLDSESYQPLGKLLSKEDTYLQTLIKSEGRRPSVHSLSEVDIISSEKYVAEVLKRGHVPPRQGVYIERKEMTEQIRTELYKLRDTDGWVVVHGLPGFGKTVLAAEAVRDAKLLQEVFPGGVNWITVGQMTDRNGEVDSAKLLLKIQNLILRLDESRYRPPNLEAATDYLQTVISEQHPRSLLILDDVWDPDVAQAFAVRCRTLVTSRNSAVASSVATPYLYSVSVAEGFSEEEAKTLLAKWVKMTPEALPSDADLILSYCRGSPMAIALIGAILRKNAREAKWKAITEKLKEKHFHSLKLHGAMNEWTYQHPTLNASIEMSVESLPAYLKQYFAIFVVFDYDTFIPAEALETIWGTDTLDTEGYLMELIGYSLALQINPGIENPDYLIFYVHNIVLDYLKDATPPQKQVELHRTVVQRYTDKCNGAYHHLPNDGYVYQKLIGHIASSGNYELVGDLLSSLNWLIASARNGDANSILAHYMEYKSNIPSQFVKDVKQFELFVSGHMYVLACEPQRDDIVQLALLQPDSSEVFCQAAAIARDNRKKSWFKWSNKDSDPEKYALQLKLHNGGVRRCQYTRDGSKVVSCSNDGLVKLWDASTGMVLTEFKGHKKDMVTCCSLSNSGRFIVSTSEDCTVKVWDVHRKRLLREFLGHGFGVQCCAISPDEKLVVSADIDSCILIWGLQTGKIEAHWRLSPPSPATPADQPDYSLAQPPSRTGSQESQGVQSCAFSPSGERLVTASQNGAVKLWTLKGVFVSSFEGHIGPVRCCVFSKSGTLLATAGVGDNTAKVWDMSSGQCEVSLKHPCSVLSCDLSQNATRLLTGDTEGHVRVWLVQQGTLLYDLPIHWDFVNCVLFSPTAPHILSAADNGIIKILWSDEEDELVSPFPTVQYHRRFSAHFYSVGSEFEPIIVCNNIKKKKLQVLKGSKAEVVLEKLPTMEGLTPRCWVMSNNGTMVVVGYTNGAIQLLSLHYDPSGKGQWTAKEMWRQEHAHSEMVLKCYFSPNDSKIVSCSRGLQKMWSVQKGKELAVVSGSGIGVRLCVFFSDNIRLASAQEKRVLIWSNDTKVPRVCCEGIVDEVHSILCINLSENNSRLVASSTSGLVVVWDSATGQPLLHSTLLPMSHCARSCALSPSGSMAAAGFDDGSLKIWNVLTGEEVAYCYTGSDYWMIDVAFSPDGSQIVTLCDSIQWWKTNGDHYKTVMLKGTFGKYIKFSPDFHTFVTIDNAGLLYILTTLSE